MDNIPKLPFMVFWELFILISWLGGRGWRVYLKLAEWEKKQDEDLTDLEECEAWILSKELCPRGLGVP